MMNAHVIKQTSGNWLVFDPSEGAPLCQLRFSNEGARLSSGAKGKIASAVRDMIEQAIDAAKETKNG
ncbi:MAG: hypothetical protein WC538_22020 [Thermoanaerobaculia bacterium]|jgi:hypothetical protein